MQAMIRGRRILGIITGLKNRVAAVVQREEGTARDRLRILRRISYATSVLFLPV